MTDCSAPPPSWRTRAARAASMRTTRAKYAATGFAKSMLEVADTLELAAKSAKDALATPTTSSSSASSSSSSPFFLVILRVLARRQCGDSQSAGGHRDDGEGADQGVG